MSIWKNTCRHHSLRRNVMIVMIFAAMLMQTGLHVTGVKAAPVTTADMDDDATQWGIYQDGGQVFGSLTNVSDPSIDGTALRIGLDSGQPYTGLHAYRNLPFSDATSFVLSLSFLFTNLDSIQALEFTTSKWSGNQRWEWALQWEHVGDGTSQQGNPPAWRLWSGTSWLDIGVSQQLGAGTWHTLQISGNISSGQVHYNSFQCDDTTIYLSQVFNPVVSSGEKLAAAAQLDGNYNEDPYQVYVDRMNLLTS